MTFSLVGFIKGLLVQHESDRSKQLSLEVDSSATTSTQTILKSAQTDDRTVTLPDATDTLVGKATTDILTNKTIDADTNVISNIENADIKALAAIDATKLANGTVSNAELQFINSVTSNVQDQLDAGVAALTSHINDTTDAHDASAISNAPSGTISATDIQSAINELDSDLTAHLVDTVDAHDASAISNIPSGNLAATDIQSAVNELQTDIDTRATSSALTTHITNPTGAHTASAITNVPSGNLVATDVQSALNELQSEVDSIIGGGEVNTASNVGTGVGQSFKQKVGVDLQFRTIKAGTGITVVNNTNDITLDVTSSTGANVTLSNLTSPTAINQDLTFANGTSRLVTIADAPASTTGNAITIKAGSSGAGTDLSGGQLTLSGGNSTGNGGSAINFNLPISQQGTGTTGRSSFLMSSLTSASNDNRFSLYNPSTNAPGIFLQSTNTNQRLRTADSGSGATPELLWILSGGNTSTGNTGAIQLDTPSPAGSSASSGAITSSTGSSVNGNSGGYQFTTGAASGTGASGTVAITTGTTVSGNSGAINFTTGTPSGAGTKGAVTVSAKTLTLSATPIVFSVATVGIAATEPQLAHGGNGIVTVTTTGASTIQGIAAGVEGQLLIIRNSSANNLSFANENASASAADRITTQTGATITSAAISMHQLVYLASRWQYLSGQL